MTSPRAAETRVSVELFVAGECFAEGATHTLTTILHEAAHALAHARGVKDTSRQGKYHNRRFVELTAEPDAAITLHLDTFRRLRLSGGGQAEPGTTTPEGDGTSAEDEGAKSFNRSKLVCDCYPERSIRVSPKQAARGPILCGVCGAEFQPEGASER